LPMSGIEAGVGRHALGGLGIRLVRHSGTSVTELVYRHQLKPVVQTGATDKDRLFGRDLDPAVTRLVMRATMLRSAAGDSRYMPRLSTVLAPRAARVRPIMCRPDRHGNGQGLPRDVDHEEGQQLVGCRTAAASASSFLGAPVAGCHPSGSTA
jgi:hypothetical protein